MKNQAFISFIAFLLLASVSFVGCDNDGGGGPSLETQALTESDIFNNPDLSANPEKGVVVDFLEHPDSEKPESDTGEVGNDTIPYTYTKTLNNTFCWEDDDGEAGHFMVLEDSEGNEIFRLDVNGECITVVLEAGDYLMHIHHDGRIEKTHPIFIIPGQNGEPEAQKIDTNEGLLKSAKSLFSKILNDLHNIITQTTNAQTPTPTPTVEDNIRTLLKTRSCVGCDLRGANLSGANLTGADLSGADLRCTAPSMGEPICTNLTDAVLTGAILTRAILAGATWCDGSICPAGSIGICETGARFMDNCDGTITDADMDLMWEKKVDGSAGSCLDDDKLHSVDTRCNWNQATGAWVDKVNSTCNNDPTVDCTTGGDADCINASVGGPCGFAGHRDWRLPEVGKDGGTAELETILDFSEGNSGCELADFINPIFCPTSPAEHWSATSFANDPGSAWYVTFGGGFVAGFAKTALLAFRAVRP